MTPVRERDTLTVTLDQNLPLSFCWVPPGSFLVGSPETEDEHEDSESPQQRRRDASGLGEDAECLGLVRHARERIRVVSGLGERADPMIRRTRWDRHSATRESCVGLASNVLLRTAAPSTAMPRQRIEAPATSDRAWCWLAGTVGTGLWGQRTDFGTCATILVSDSHSWRPFSHLYWHWYWHWGRTTGFSRAPSGYTRKLGSEGVLAAIFRPEKSF